MLVFLWTLSQKSDNFWWQDAELRRCYTYGHGHGVGQRTKRPARFQRGEYNFTIQLHIIFVKQHFNCIESTDLSCEHVWHFNKIAWLLYTGVYNSTVTVSARLHWRQVPLNSMACIEISCVFIIMLCQWYMLLFYFKIGNQVLIS